jgi:plasmid stability protein
MPSITLKSIPVELLESLRARAAANHRSLNGEILHILTRVVRESSHSAELVSRIEARRRQLEAPMLTDDPLRSARDDGRP